MSNKVIIGIVVVLVVILAIWFYMQNGTPVTTPTDGTEVATTTTDGTMSSSTEGTTSTTDAMTAPATN